MSPTDPSPSDKTESPLVLDSHGQPRSRLYGDIYFSTEDGLAESQAVFLQGCGLPEQWGGRRRFTVAELGFGTGLNILALLDLWRAARPPGARLHIFTVEAHPLSAEAASEVLAAWPELADLARRLTDRWPGQARGFHRVDFPELDATLDVAVMEVEAALRSWSGMADAWFLDGFSPALNPQMWRDEVLELVAARTAPGGRLATFTVAGAVRRGLQAQGFEVAKRPGHGRKRERLEAWTTNAPAPQDARTRVAVIGAGVAGAALARALRQGGAEVQVFDAGGPGRGASGNPAALVTPRLDAGLGPLAGLFAQALARAGRLYGAIPGAVLDHGVLQLARQPKDEDRFKTIAASDLFEPGALEVMDDAAAGRWTGEAVEGAGLAQRAALVVRPAAILSAWLGDVNLNAISALAPLDRGWALLGPEGHEVWRGDAVAVCAGAGGAGLLAEAPLQAVRGQISIAPGLSGRATAWGGYVAPSPEGLVFGATHDRDDDGAEVRPTDHERNLETLAQALPHLAAEARTTVLAGRASVRAVTPDRLPLAGPAPGGAQGLFVLGGLGSRGFCLAPLLAEHLAAQMLGAPSPLPREMAELVDPDRFRRRAMRRAGRTPD
ncbi:FAD-dependent 5-carboxymethylaminomethyl-2-thiouridine(34) oxidoreductase MnmC [Phenylobacterium sp.]|uniref:FAD-dependent 5-carboxymethylaminomethyl-2-thiouridine(34) oxidoreductase MnmC n=1 Tax=Phenylobacterium sp. TaxID=1871053 RepID=UPI0027317B76|nr:FAD-dependent 5-carboxymethylaminomethyl-2-thiouridine(34) oxidoreductase MnmC [Phenylobacterium sp.]MDP1616421.1 FAD-dependent 5-carboxymethylaminomethyl-2-thiouridine(34) oxidoreductase MnmC [Phenylobacterium sp.]MDP1986080.1 FAD-dependent 5-carboxymethylaminomethyl-2-thiouridine(34) oxidoreductase MnmC [Phenylobacterium sp.]